MGRGVLVGALLLAGCGGAPPRPADPAPARPTRHVIEDTATDDEPTDGVEMVSTRGRMDPAAVQAGIEPHAAELSACYTDQVGRRRWLGGHVEIHWDITAAGQATPRIDQSTLGAYPIEHCLLLIASAATFAKPHGGDTEFSLPLDFSAKGIPQEWTEDRAVRAVGGQLALLDACSEPWMVDDKGRPVPAGRKAEAARRRSGMEGPVSAPHDLTVTLYVGPGGKAQSVGFSSTATDVHPDWAACATRVVLAWRLPDPRGTVAKLAVRYHPS